MWKNTIDDCSHTFDDCSKKMFANLKGDRKNIYQNYVQKKPNAFFFDCVETGGGEITLVHDLISEC